MAQRALNETPRKRQIAILRTLDIYMLVEAFTGERLEAIMATPTLFNANAPVDLVIAVTRHRNPGATVFFWDDDRAVFRIH